MKLNYFSSFTCSQPVDSTLTHVAEVIRDNSLVKSLTLSYRQTNDKNVKAQSPLFAVACHFNGGKRKEHVTNITSLSLCDFDHVPPERMEEARQLARSDPHTLLCYTTISGLGLRIIFRYELPPNTTTSSIDTLSKYYQRAFAMGNRYYEGRLHLEADRQCKNITRLSGIAHDPDVVLNEEAIPFSHQEITDDTSQQLFLDKKQRQRQRIQHYYDTIIVPQLEQEGIVFAPGHHNGYVMRVGYMLAEKRFNFQTALQWAISEFSDYDDVQQVFTSCFAAKKGVRQDSVPTKRTASVNEIRNFLDTHILLRFNEVTGRAEFAFPPPDGVEAQKDPLWIPISDRIVNSLWVSMSESTIVSKLDIINVIDSDYTPRFNPFHHYLDNLPPADDTDYILQLAQTVRVKGDDEQQLLWYRYLKKWLVAMVASWLKPEVVNNVILVLIGEQGSYKTTWFSYLLPPPLRPYFYTKTNANRLGRDDLLVLAQYALVCCEELDTLRPPEVNQLKAIVTAPSINERAAYARYHECRPHVASFCGTGNNIQFLTDTTGNRRWMPFEVDHILSPRDNPFPYEGIYAQALHLLNTNFRYWFDREEMMEQSKHNKHFEAPRLEVELVAIYFRKPVGNETGDFVTVARALQIVSLNISQKLSAINIGKAFVELGFEKIRTKKVRGFLAIQRSNEEVKLYLRRLSYTQPDDVSVTDEEADDAPF